MGFAAHTCTVQALLTTAPELFIYIEEVLINFSAIPPLS